MARKDAAGPGRSRQELLPVAVIARAVHVVRRGWNPHGPFGVIGGPMCSSTHSYSHSSSTPPASRRESYDVRSSGAAVIVTGEALIENRGCGVSEREHCGIQLISQCSSGSRDCRASVARLAERRANSTVHAHSQRFGSYSRGDVHGVAQKATPSGSMGSGA